jgi:hypothetical protein
MFSVEYLLKQDSNNLKQSKNDDLILQLNNNIICHCCKREIKGGNKPIFKKFSIAICIYCRNYYRKHCLFFGHRSKNNVRYELCHKYMCDDNMVCKKIPDWILKSLRSNSKFNMLKNNDYYFWCKLCQSIAKCPQDFFSNTNCLCHYWIRKNYNNNEEIQENEKQ